MSPGSGTTLIELLLAIVIALLVIGAVFSMYHTATRVVETQDAVESGPAAAARALEGIVRDLQCAALPEETPDCRFLLGPAKGEDAGEVHLGFCTAGRPAGDDTRWVDFQKVLYRFRPGSDRDGVLARETTPLAGPGSGEPVEEDLVQRVEEMEMEAFDGTDWVAEWKQGGLPRGVRFRLVIGGQAYAAEAFIPVACVVTSTLIRAAAPAP